eukprot:jgi/Ulvmu1/879/UM100_0032.1
MLRLLLPTVGNLPRNATRASRTRAACCTSAACCVPHECYVLRAALVLRGRATGEVCMKIDETVVKCVCIRNHASLYRSTWSSNVSTNLLTRAADTVACIPVTNRGFDGARRRGTRWIVDVVP